MLKFKKDFNVKLIAILAIITFLSNSTAYGIDIVAKSHLRVSLGIDKARIAQALSESSAGYRAGTPNKASEGVEKTRRRVVERATEPLVEQYKQLSQRQRKALANEPTYEEVFLEKILPEIRRRYLAYLRGEERGSPLALLLISGGGGSAKTSVANWFQNIANKELGDLARQEGKDVKNPFRTINFDNYILEPADRPIDPLTRKSTQNPYEKFQVDRFIKDMMALSEGQVIYAPVFDFSLRGRLKLIQDEEGNVIILNGGEKAVVRIANDLLEPSILYANKSLTEVKIGETTVSVFRNSEGYVVIRIHNTDHVIITSQPDKAIMTVRVDNHERQLAKDKPIEVWERVDPEGKIIVAEGILTLSSKELNKQALSVFIDAEYWPRLLRMLVRFNTETGRKESKSDFIGKRMTLRLTEEIPFIVKTREFAQFLVSTQTRSESILTFFLAGMLKRAEKLSPEVLEAFRELNIEPSALNEELQKISLEEIRRRLRMGGVVDYTAGSSFWVFFLDGELVLKSPRREFQSQFEKFVLFHEDVLKQRLGDLMVPSTVVDVTDLGITQMVDGERLRLGKVIVQGRVEPLSERFSRLSKQREELYERLKTFSAETNMGETQALYDAYIKLDDDVRGLMVHYFELQQELWERGIVDTDPRFTEKYGLMIINGQEQLVVIGLDGLTDNPDLYDPNIFRRKKIRPTGLSGILLKYYASLAKDMVPSKKIFLAKYFKTNLQKAFFVPDVSDVEISEMQMRHIVGLVKKAKISMLYKLFNMLSISDGHPEIYWAKLYLDTVYVPGTPQYKVVETIYEQMINDAKLLAGKKNMLDAMLQLVRAATQGSVLTAVDQYKLAEDLIYYTLESKVPAALPVNRPIVDRAL